MPTVIYIYTKWPFFPFGLKRVSKYIPELNSVVCFQKITDEDICIYEYMYSPWSFFFIKAQTLTFLPHWTGSIDQPAPPAKEYFFFVRGRLLLRTVPDSRNAKVEYIWLFFFFYFTFWGLNFPSPHPSWILLTRNDSISHTFKLAFTRMLSN